MAAPTPTARATPAGIPLGDGHSTLITFAANDDVKFWEMSITPPGADGGEPIPTSSMHNTMWRTKRPRSLMDLTDCSITAQYDPGLYNEILFLINVETTITTTFCDGSTLAFFGYLRSFTPQEVQEGAVPLCQLVIVPTNWDYIHHVEAGPTFTDVTGT